MNSAETAVELGITPRRVGQLIKEGKLVATKTVLGYEIEPDALAEYTERQATAKADVAAGRSVERDLPPHLQKGREEADWSRLLHYGRDHLHRYGTTLRVSDQAGYWGECTTQDTRALHSLLIDCRLAAVADAERETADLDDDYPFDLRKSFQHSASYLRSLASMSGVVADRAGRKLAKMRPYAGDIGRYLPTDDDDQRSIDLDTGELAAPEVVRLSGSPQTTWKVPLDYYQPSILTDTPPTAVPMRDFCNRLGHPLIARLGRHLRYTSKDIDVVRIPQSNAGKSTLIDALRRCTGGGVWSDPESKSLTERGSRFSQATAPLTQYRLVFYDEVDKIPEIKHGLLNSITTETPSIERKGIDPRDGQRTGQPILIGGDWPTVDLDGQGVPDRLRWAWNKEDVAPIDEQERQAILHPDGLTWLLTALVAAARRVPDFTTGYKMAADWHNMGDQEAPAAETDDDADYAHEGQTDTAQPSPAPVANLLPGFPRGRLG